MSLDPGVDAHRVDVHRLAAAARSILSCPEDVQLVVDGIDDLAEGLAGDHLEMQDHGGRPVFTCPGESALAAAAADGRGALLTLRSGLGRAHSAERDATLILSGRLATGGPDTCPCCDEVRLSVVLEPDFAVLARDDASGATPAEARLRVPLAAFASPLHDLNRGFLQRSVEHANLCHQDELRRAVATRTNRPLGDVVGVHLAWLDPTGVELQWVDVTGAHQSRLRFARTATDAQDLGELLRDELHAGLC